MTETLDTYIRSHWDETNVAIARRFDVSRERVRQVRDHLGLPKPEDPDLDRVLKTLKRLRGHRPTMRQIATDLDVDYDWLRRLRRRDTRVDEQLARLLDNGDLSDRPCSRCGRPVRPDELASRGGGKTYTWCRRCNADRIAEYRRKVHA
jgi:hypothetical protein